MHNVVLAIGLSLSLANEQRTFKTKITEVFARLYNDVVDGHAAVAEEAPTSFYDYSMNPFWQLTKQPVPDGAFKTFSTRHGSLIFLLVYGDHRYYRLTHSGRRLRQEVQFQAHTSRVDVMRL